MSNKVVQIIYFTGEVEWCKPNKIDMYNRYTCNVYLDKKSLEKYKQSGIQLRVRKNDEGREFVTFKRDHSRLIGDEVKIFGPPEVLSSDNSSLDPRVMIGNGSTCTLKVRVYDTSRGKGSSWDAIRVDNLIPYEVTVVEQDTDIDEPF